MEKQHEQEHVVMEVPELDGELLVELLDTSLAAEEEELAGREQQLGLTADVVVGDGWEDSQELNSIHPHQEGCEDCGLDDILSDFEGCGCSPAPYFVVDDNPVDEYWTEEMEAAAAGPFTGECMGEWYMDGMVMEWDDGRSYYSFYSSYGGEASIEQLYSGSPLWE